MIVKENINPSTVSLSLNRPEALNALSVELILSLQSHLKDLENDQAVNCVILKSSIKKAFCAGGDIIKVCQDIRDKNYEKAMTFFRQEYDMHILLRSMKTPVIGIAEGFCIGGGLGLLNSCTYKVITESTKAAMPEAMIGFFPDVGSSCFLSSTEFGLFLALSAQKIKTSDILLCGLADYYIPSDNLKQIFLADLSSADKIEKTLTALDQKNNLQKSELELNQIFIKQISKASSIKDFDQQLNSYEGDNQWMLKAIENFKYSSKHSLKFIFQQLRQKHSWPDTVLFDKEYKIAEYFVKYPDLLEGVRALLQDKDKMPNWKSKDYSNIIIDDKILEQLN